MSNSISKAYYGIAASDGLVFAPVVRFEQQTDIMPSRYVISADHINGEIARFYQSLDLTRQQFLELAQKTEQNASSKEASIFDSHLMMIEDSFFIEKIVKHIRNHHINAESVVYAEFDEMIKMMLHMGDDYMRERITDLHDVRNRLIMNLSGDDSQRRCPNITQPSIIVADSISPSDAVSLPQQYIRGFATEHGSLTAHTTVLARALGVPAVVGLNVSLDDIASGDEIALDGFHGVIWLNPNDEIKTRLLAETAKQRAAQDHRKRLADQPAITPDGVKISLLANTDHSVGFSNISEHGAEGIGLYRTEYLWLGLGREPTEEEQYHAYSEVLRSCIGKPVTLRVLDIGGDKLIGRKTSIHGEDNPFLGNRSIRYLLSNKNVFRTQIRAILRAGVTGNCRMMFPMVSTLDELRVCFDFVDKCKAELTNEGIPFRNDVPIGIMIEVPSAVLQAERLAQYAHFFSVGTNDLVQYTFAVDRGNESVAYLYQPLHPVILKMISMTVQAARQFGRSVCVCGEMASNPMAAVLLIGMGIRELSMSANLIPRIKELICRIDYYDMQRIVDSIKRDNCDSSDAIVKRCREFISKYAPDVLN